MGNTRVSFARNSAGASEILDTGNYYAFGLNHIGGNGLNSSGFGSWQSYKYNGKELQETGMYDYGARMYMSDLGRWGVIDPLAETSRRFSPYNYAVNNPVMFIDPDGRKVRYYRAPSAETIPQPGGGMLGFLGSGGIPNRAGLLNFLGYGEKMGAFYDYGDGEGGGRGATFDQTEAYRDLMSGRTNNITNVNGYMSWWTGGAAGDANTSQEMIAHILNLNSDNIDWHKTSQGFRSWSGNAYSANQFVFQPAADRAALYGASKAFSTTNLVFEKTILGQKIYQPLLEMSAIKAQRFATGTKYAGRVLGGVGIVLAGVDIKNNGVNMSNSLDLVMSVLAVSPTGWGQAIAGTYFMTNFVTQLVTGKDIGQHIEGAVNKYYNDGVRAEEQRKYNEAMGY